MVPEAPVRLTGPQPPVHERTKFEARYSALRPDAQ